MSEEFKVNDLTVRIEQDQDPLNPREEWDCHVGTMVCWHRRYNLGDKHDLKDSGELYASLFDSCEPTDEEIREVLSVIIKSEEGQQDYCQFFQNSRGWQSKLDTRRDFVREYAANWEYIPQEVKHAISEVVLSYHTILPLYLYDHSGITMNTSGFMCGWDSGQVGYIYVSHKKLAKEWGQGIDEPVVRRDTQEILSPSLREYAVDILKSEVEVYDQYLTGDIWGYVIEDEEGNHIDSCWSMLGREYCEEEAKSQAEWFSQEQNRPTYCI
ncbi:MAG: hypothetical protein CMK32_08220 [Porticoccaceae bacterium]|nr:hypothetical protein [Porticoccaceae bacterium]